MTTLKDILCSNDNRRTVVTRTVELVDREVDSKSGISGLAIKASYKAVKAVKPGLIPEAVDSLLERFVERLEPFFKEWTDGGKAGTFGAFLNQRTTQVANALLGVTDDRARHVANTTIKKTYETLRPQGEKNVIAAIPRLGDMLSQFVR